MADALLCVAGVCNHMPGLFAWLARAVAPESGEAVPHLLFARPRPVDATPLSDASSLFYRYYYQRHLCSVIQLLTFDVITARLGIESLL